MDFSIYAPANSKNLLPEQIAAMEFFTIDQLRELARLFPNKAVHNTYLILKDNRKTGKQLHPRSTWENLLNLHAIGQKHFVAATFADLFQKQPDPVRTAPVQDLTNQEAKAALKQFGPKATVTKTVDTAQPQQAKEIGDDEDFDDLKDDAANMNKGSEVLQEGKTTKQPSQGITLGKPAAGKKSKKK